jgi:hypothetical protein
MRSTPLSKRKPAGGVMVIALVAIGFVTVGFSTWVGLLAQRGRSAEIEQHATQRRIAASNARAAIKAYALDRMIASSGDTDGIAFDELSGWGSTTSAAWAGYPMDSATRLAGLNAFSPTWDYPYSKVIDVAAGMKKLGFTTTGTGRVEQDLTDSAAYYKTYIRSRSPILGGDLLILHRSRSVPAANPTVTGNIKVSGRVMHFVPELEARSYTALSARFVAAPGTSPMTLQPKDLNGVAIPPSNLTWTPITFGKIDNVTDFTGGLNVIDDPTNGGNSLVQELTASAASLQSTGGTALSDSRGFENNGNGTVTITPCIGPSKPADLPSVVINSEVSELIIEGQDGTNFTGYAQYRPALAVAYVQDAGSVRKLNTIRLRKQDRRRMILAIKQEGPAAGTPVNIIIEDTNSVSEWNLVILAENTPLVFTASPQVSTIKLAGGIQTDAPLTGPGGGQDLAIVLQSDTHGLIKLTPRAAWVETIMPDKIPGTTTDNTW